MYKKLWGLFLMPSFLFSMESLKKYFFPRRSYQRVESPFEAHRQELINERRLLHQGRLCDVQKYNTLHDVGKCIYKASEYVASGKDISDIQNMLELCIATHKDIIFCLPGFPLGAVNLHTPIKYENGMGRLPAYNDLENDLALLNNDPHYLDVDNDMRQKFLFLHRIGQRIFDMAELLQPEVGLDRNEFDKILRLYAVAYRSVLRILHYPEKCLATHSKRSISSFEYVEDAVEREEISICRGTRRQEI